MAQQMSETQAKILNFIREYSRREGRPPTNREIGEKVEIHSTGHVDYHLTMLAKKGLIVREPRKSRGIRLVEEQGLRIAGKIAAGLPLDISDDQHERLDLGGAHERDEYVLQVQGESMIEDHIADGDYVLIKPVEKAENGNIIVATHMTSDSGTSGAATLKRFYREKGRVRLQPANSTMEPIYIPADEWDNEWKIQGIVTAVYRNCR